MKLKKIFLGAAIMVAPFLWSQKASAAMTQTSTQPRTDMVDVSSRNAYVSVADYQQMKTQGVKAVVVKASEGTTYKNPYAKEQTQNAEKAGLSVNFYHFSHFTSVSDAQAEANYFADYVQTITSDRHVVMVNDEESATSTWYTFAQNNLFNSAFTKQLNQRGYYSTDIYSSASWFNYRFSTDNANKGWVAAYPNVPTGTNYSTRNSWQWGSDFQFWNMLGRNFDVSQNYSDKYYHVGTSNASDTAQDIHNGTAPATTSSLSVGDTVYIKTAASKYYGSNTSIPKFVKNKNYHVLSVSGNRVVIREIMSAVSRTDVVKVNNSSQTASASLPAGVHAQNGYFHPSQRLMVWTSAGYGSTGVHYYPGESIHYQGYIRNGAYIYVVYQSASGHWRYVADRRAATSYPLGWFE